MTKLFTDAKGFNVTEEVALWNLLGSYCYIKSTFNKMDGTSHLVLKS